MKAEIILTEWKPGDVPFSVNHSTEIPNPALLQAFPNQQLMQQVLDLRKQERELIEYRKQQLNLLKDEFREFWESKGTESETYQFIQSNYPELLI